MNKEELFARFGRRFYHHYVTQIADVIDFFEILPNENCLRRVRIVRDGNFFDYPEIYESFCDISDICDFLLDAVVPLNSKNKSALNGRKLLQNADSLLGKEEEDGGEFYQRYAAGTFETARLFRKCFEIK